MEHISEAETQYGKVKIRKLWLKDPSGEGKITLWQKHATMDLELGGHCSMSHLNTSKYQGETSFSTTFASKIEVCHSVGLCKSGFPIFG
jgi:hypothetical protein